MSQKDTFAELRYSQEEKYFIEKEQELLQTLRARAELEHEIENLTHSKAAVKKDLLRDLQSLGYTRETFPLLFIVPLVYVAWAEGFVTDVERHRVNSIARKRGIEENSAAYLKLQTWLDASPTEEFFQKSLGIVQTLLHALPPEEEAAEKLELISEVREVAEASRNLLGHWGLIPRVEKETIERIIAELEREHY